MLDHLVTFGVPIAAFLVGVFSSTYIKDTINGVPSELRTALSAAETSAAATLKTASAKAVSDVTTTLAKAVPTPAPVAKVVAVPATPAAPAAPAA